MTSFSHHIPRSYCFVVPRYFEGIAGGAETLMGSLARELSRRGDSVELLATCARDNRTWTNEFPAGPELIDGVRVVRFPVSERALESWIPVQVAIHEGETVSPDDQLVWMRESVNSSELYSYLLEEGSRFDAIFFGPYLFGTTLWGSMIHPGKSFLIPCLHDEVYAYLDIIAAMFRNARGCLFNAAPEMHLARSLYGDIPGDVVGMGFTPPTTAEVVNLEPYFEEPFPYLLYLGRKEMGKNAHLLIDYFLESKRAGLIPDQVKLVILGGGSFSDLHRDGVLDGGHILDLPHLSEREKQRVIRHALYLCQPSVNESFSIVIMEAWLLGVPVVVHGSCAVTRHHVVESSGGLYFSSPADLAGVTRYLLENPETRSILARNGEEYVRREYSWPAVLSRFDKTMEVLVAGHEGSGARGEGSPS